MLSVTRRHGMQHPDENKKKPSCSNAVSPSLHPLTPPSTGLSNPIMDPLPPARMQNLLQALPKSPSEHRPHRDATSSPTKSQQPTRFGMANPPRPPIPHRRFPLFANQQRRRPLHVADHRAHEPGCVQLLWEQRAYAVYPDADCACPG